MPRDSTRELTPRRRGASEDDRFVVLKRRVQLLARMSGAIVRLADGPYVVAIERITGADEVLAALRERGALDLRAFERLVRTKQPPLRIDAALLANARRELRALAAPPALAMARERRRALARYGTIDEAWLRAREADVAAAAEAFADRTPPVAGAWFDRIVELVRAREGAAAADRVQNAHDDVLAAAAERRKRARARVTAIGRALESAAPPDDPEIARLAERLDAARDFPGRARRRRVLDVLRQAIGWPDAPADAVAPLAARGAERAFAEAVLTAGLTLADRLPVVRDPKHREQALEVVALLALSFPLGDEGVPSVTPDDAAKLLDKKKELASLASTGATASQAVTLAALAMPSGTRTTLAAWVAEGLELALVVDAAEKGWATSLAQVPDVRAARAYATWASRLVPHYQALDIPFTLPPELFARLPRNADLGVLAICLLEATKVDDPAAVLDATLGLFAKLPAKATRIVGRLRETEAGAGRRAFPDFAAWLDDDALLDRYLHVATLAGEGKVLTHRIREDFDRATKTARELAHLASLARRNVPQEGRLALLRKGPRRIEDAPKGRTKRRIAERIEALLPVAYRRELDGVFREIMRDAWGIEVPALTPAWRDAVRFWLVVDDNRDLLGQLLREAAKAPGQDVKLTSAKNRAWVERASLRIDVAAWLAPREKTLVAPSGARFRITLELDPLEVLRMGIPFGTCLSLEDGCNAASTVLNAFDANKRVIYVRGESGKVVARKLVALGESFELLGYNLYLSLRGGDEAAIRSAVEAMCLELARDVGTELAGTGAPPKIHEGFWYDDGTVPFSEDAVLAAYCRAHGLEPPAKPWGELVVDARGWAATDADDVDAAMAALRLYQTNIASVLLGRWIVGRLGIGQATRRLRTTSHLLPALARVLADGGEDGAVRALGLAARSGESAAYHAIPQVLARFPRSAKLASAFVAAAEEALERTTWVAKWGTAHRTFEEVAPLFDDVASSLALLDRLDRTWAAIAVRLPACDACRKKAEIGAIRAVADAFVRARDDEAVVAVLTGARRSPLARRAALRIAARHVLAGGARAIARLATLDRELAASPASVAAHLVQAGVDRITGAVLEKVPAPDALPYEALGPLLFTCADIEKLIARGPPIPKGKRDAGPWELAYRRRRGDVDGDLVLEEQVTSGDAGRFDVVEAPTFDRWYVELARRAAAHDARAAMVFANAAGAFVGAANVVRELLAAPPSAATDAALVVAIGKCPRSALAPDLVVAIWQRASLRAALVNAFAKGTPAFGAAFEAVERAAARAGASIDGFFEAAVLAQLAAVPAPALVVDSIERLREVVAVAVRDAPPRAAAALYEAMHDVPAVAAFLRALRRAPVDRAAAIRQAATLDDSDPHGAALAAWLRSTRSLRDARASSIERE